MAQNTSNPLGIVFAGALALVAIGAYMALGGEDKDAPQAVGATEALASGASGKAGPDAGDTAGSAARHEGASADRFGGERELAYSTDGEKALGEDASPSLGGSRVRGKTINRQSETEMLADQAARDSEYIGNGQSRSSSAARQREADSDWGQ